MKLQDAIKEASRIAKDSNISMAVVDEGLHADEYAELPSYGYCPKVSVNYLYRYAKIVKIIN